MARKISIEYAGAACHVMARGNQLAETRKGSWEKEVLAWWLCQHTRQMPD